MTLGLLIETMRKLRLLIAGGTALLLAQALPATAQEIACSAPLKAMLEIDLMFGRNIGGALGVSEGTWSDFVASEITPRFPDGLTARCARSVARQRRQHHRARAEQGRAHHRARRSGSDA